MKTQEKLSGSQSLGPTHAAQDSATDPRVFTEQAKHAYEQARPTIIGAIVAVCSVSCCCIATYLRRCC